MDGKKAEIKPFFVKCSLEKFDYFGKVVNNNSVNLSVCESIKKGKFSWYPDNIGRPSIIFQGCNTQWSYNDIETRNKDYESLSNNEFNNNKS